MAIEKIEKADLKHYFDNLSRILPDESVQIEVVGMDVGDQLAADNVRLEGISHDESNDEIVIHLANAADHNISGPQEVYVEQNDNGLQSMEITCSKGHKHIIKLKVPA